MAELTWSDNDARDARGRRVASVVRVFDLGPGVYAVQGVEHSGFAFFAPRRYWEAYVAFDGRFDHALVDGAPGRWTKELDTKAAVEAAYLSWAADSDTDVDGTPAEPTDRPPHPPGGVIAQIRDLVRSWRTVPPR